MHMLHMTTSFTHLTGSKVGPPRMVLDHISMKFHRMFDRKCKENVVHWGLFKPSRASEIVQNSYEPDNFHVPPSRMNLNTSFKPMFEHFGAG